MQIKAQKRFPKMFILILSVVVLVFILSSCCPVVSEKPLSQPLKIDTDLEGVWQLESENQEIVYLHISALNEKFAAVSVEHRDDGKLDIIKTMFFLTRIKLGLYMNIHTNELPKEELGTIDGWMFLQIKFFNKDRFAMAHLNDQPIIDAVRNGELSGILTQRDTRVNCVALTDSSENMRNYIETHGDSLFIDPTVWNRVH